MYTMHILHYWLDIKIFKNVHTFEMVKNLLERMCVRFLDKRKVILKLNITFGNDNSDKEYYKNIAFDLNQIIWPTQVGMICFESDDNSSCRTIRHQKNTLKGRRCRRKVCGRDAIVFITRCIQTINETRKIERRKFGNGLEINFNKVDCSNWNFIEFSVFFGKKINLEKD